MSYSKFSLRLVFEGITKIWHMLLNEKLQVYIHAYLSRIFFKVSYIFVHFEKPHMNLHVHTFHMHVRICTSVCIIPGIDVEYITSIINFQSCRWARDMRKIWNQQTYWQVSENYLPGLFYDLKFVYDKIWFQVN